MFLGRPASFLNSSCVVTQGIQSARDLADLGEFAGYFADNMRGQHDGVLHHIGVLLDILLHHLELCGGLLNGFIVFLEQRFKLFKAGGLFYGLRHPVAAICAINSVCGAGVYREEDECQRGEKDFHCYLLGVGNHFALKPPRGRQPLALAL